MQREIVGKGLRFSLQPRAVRPYLPVLADLRIAQVGRATVFRARDNSFNAFTIGSHRMVAMTSRSGYLSARPLTTTWKLEGGCATARPAGAIRVGM